jgi:hypothetical protein
MTTITTLPDAPSRTDPDTFSSKSDALLGALATFVSETNTVAGEVNANAITATTQAGLATTNGAAQVALATAQADAAADSAAAAANSALMAGAVVWVSGTTYAIGDARYSPITFLTYRRKTSGAGTTDPSLDSTNWELVASALPTLASNNGRVLGTNGTAVSWVDSNVTYTKSSVVTLAVGTAASTLYDTVTIDATRELLIFTSTTAVHAVAWDNSTETFGTAVLVRAVSAAPAVGSVLVGTDKVLVASGMASSTAFEAVVLSLTGTAITVGTAATQTLPVALHSNAGNGLTDGLYKDAVTCGSTYVFSYKSTTYRLIAITVSGTTPTIGTSIATTSSSSLASIRPIDSTRFLAVYISGANIGALPVTVSAGTTLTAGTLGTITGSAFRYLTSLTTGRWAVVYTNTNSYGGIISVSGTTATITGVELNAAADAAQGAVVKIGDQLIVQCSATKVNVLTDVSGTATAGTAVTTGTLGTSLAACGFGSDYAVIGGTAYYSIIKISGNNPVLYDQNAVATGLISSASGLKSYDGDPPLVLSSGTKSATVLKTASPTVLAFNSSGPYAILATNLGLGASGFVSQSASIGWCASQGVTASASIRVTRMEML